MKNFHSMVITLHPHYLEIIVMFRPLNMFSYKKHFPRRLNSVTILRRFIIRDVNFLKGELRNISDARELLFVEILFLLRDFLH